jgi:deazaflavin-dependent oxidoreductase (nitroreductase family)
VKQPERHFVAPGFIASALNRFYGWLASLGLGPSYSFQLHIAGRKTGRIYSTPVNVLRFGEKIYLVGTRGHTQWSRNALVKNQLTLKRGRISMRFHLRALTDQEKPEILQAYLTRFAWMVGRFFPVSASAPVTEFAAIAPRYPVFELLSDSSDPTSKRNPA